MKSFCENCKKQCKKINFEICKEKAIIPSETNKEIRNLLIYFQYKAPNIESNKSSKIDRKYHEEILSKMLDETKMNGIGVFCQTGKMKDKLEDFNLKEDIFCSNCPRFVCSLKSANKGEERETNLECLMRHLRNAIAHASVYIIEEKFHKRILFCDINLRKSISARIICTPSTLRKWKKILVVESKKANESGGEING